MMLADMPTGYQTRDHWSFHAQCGRTRFRLTKTNGKLLLVDTPTGLRHHAYGGDMVDFRTAQEFDFQAEARLRSLPFVRAKTVRTGPNSMRIIVDQASTATPELMGWAQQQNIQVQAVEDYTPSFEDVFVELVRPEVNHG
jgi:hypothetical protein